MKNTVYAIILVWSTAFLSGFAFGQEQQLPMTCGDAENIINGMNNKYEEKITWMSPSKNYLGDDLFHSLWLNHETQTWTFLVLNKQKSIVCIIASGTGFKLLDQIGI